MAFLLSSCSLGPMVVRTPKGGYIATAGGTLAAKRENVVAEVVTREGDTIRYSTTNEDSTEVPTSLIRWKFGVKLAKVQSRAIEKGTEDVTATKLGEQSVQKADIAAKKEVALGEQAAEALE